MDRRSQRHLGTRREIIDAAWNLSRERGLTGWSLRDLAQTVGMRAPSLYVYFPSKDAIYDAMFAQGYQQLLDGMRSTEVPSDPRAVLHLIGRGFFEFALADPARMQLMFWRVIPGFEPSAESYATSVEVLQRTVKIFADIGISDPAAIEVWTALMSGLATQQAANDPHGDTWRRHVEDVVEMFATRFLPGR